MIDDMNYHIGAWHTIVNELGANISYGRMKAECYGKNHELLERIFPGKFSEEEKDRMSLEKEKAYQQAFKPQLKLIEGLPSFLENANSRGLKMAIASAAIMFNIDFVIDGTGIRHYFSALVSADNVATSKPDPETFLVAAKQLKITPEDCLVFEDTPKGVEAALNANMKCIVLTTLHQPDEFKEYPNIIHFANDYTSIWPALELQKIN